MTWTYLLYLPFNCSIRNLKSREATEPEPIWLMNLINKELFENKRVYEWATEPEPEIE